MMAVGLSKSVVPAIKMSNPGVPALATVHHPCCAASCVVEGIRALKDCDGNRTLEELIHADPRASIVAGIYLKRFKSERDMVLAAGETRRLVEAGNPRRLSEGTLQRARRQRL